MLKPPGDPAAYPQDPRSKLAIPGLPDGTYVYVQDEFGRVFVLHDGPHLHPRVLGEARLAMYAGDLTIQAHQVIDITNLSGTFEFDDPHGLLEVVRWLKEQGWQVAPGAVRFFACDGMTPPVTLN